jgi:hypothetical protein
MRRHSAPAATTAGSEVKIRTSDSLNDTYTTATASRKAMLAQPVIQTERSARSGCPAPRFCPTRVAAALDTPHEGSRVKMKMRTAMV